MKIKNKNEDFIMGSLGTILGFSLVFGVFAILINLWIGLIIIIFSISFLLVILKFYEFDSKENKQEGGGE